MERNNRTVVERVQSLLNAKLLTDLLWGEAFLSFIHTVNALPSASLKKAMSPHEALFKKKPDLAALRTWGCLVHIHIAAESRTQKAKLTPRAAIGILLGYAQQTKGYRVLDVVSGSILS